MAASRSVPDPDWTNSDATQAPPGPVCGVCAYYHTCNAICDVVEALLPSVERARVDAEDLPRLHMGIRLTHALLDHEEILTPRQREVVRLYYRETLLQQQIAERLGISQQAVNDSLQRARLAVGKHIQGLVKSVTRRATAVAATADPNPPRSGFTGGSTRAP